MIRKKMEIRKREGGSARNLKILKIDYQKIYVHREWSKWGK